MEGKKYESREELDFGYRQKLRGPIRVPASAPTHTHEWEWQEFAEETHYVINGRDYSHREAALRYLIDAGIFSPPEAEEYLNNLNIRDWGNWDLSLDQALKYEAFRKL